MYRSNEELFKHIFDEIVFLESETRTISKEVFLKDEKTQRAFARSIEIIGEAVKNISSDVIIKYKEIPEFKNQLIKIMDTEKKKNDNQRNNNRNQ